MQEKSIRYKPYFVRFALWYVGLSVALMVAMLFIPLLADTKMSIIIPFCAATMVADYFVKSEKRAPTKLESRRLSNGSWLILLAISLLTLPLAIPALQGSGLEAADLPLLLPVFAGFLAFGFVVAYLSLRFSYGWMARLQARRAGFVQAPEQAQ